MTCQQISCPDNCDICNSPTECALCSAGYQLDSAGVNCELICPENYALSDGICKIVCLDTQYRLDETTCLDCHFSCATCDQAEMCTSCVSEDLVLQSDGSCTKSCDKKKFFNPLTLDCDLCLTGCAECQDKATCN